MTDTISEGSMSPALAASVEHQRLSKEIQSLDLSEPYGCFYAGLLPAWQIVIEMAREVWDSRGEDPHYREHLRFLAFRDAADAIARKAIAVSLETLL